MSGREGISRTPAGRWRVAVRLGSGRMYRATFDTLDEAKAGRDKARDAARAGAAVLDARTSKVTVADVAAAYLAGKAPTWTLNSRRTNASTWAALAPTFGHVRVVSLRVSHVADWHAAETAAPNTVHQRLALLRAVLDRAAADLGVVNVARLYKPTRRRRAAVSQTARALTRDEAGAVLDAVREPYRLLAMLALSLGLRSGEARGLTIDRVDFQTGWVTIDRQLVRLRATDEWPAADRVSANQGFGRPKTAQSERTVRAGRQLLDAISEHVEQYGVGPAGLLVHRDGEPITQSAWADECKRVRALTGVDFVGHSFRHTRATWAIGRGDSLDKVAGDLGQNVGTTLRTYAHASSSDDGSTSDDMLALPSSAGARATRAERHLRAV